ncbi:hypothetical protein Tco_0752711 [Tanacetum coccineum]|uniref:Uncharacterized protein n=1 Tax=Tanacetum coccineum TaxID=301880 RepID=A0ABQ4ZAX6_9ASTR
MEWLQMFEKLEKAVGGRYWLDMMIVYCRKLADEHRDFTDRVSREDCYVLEEMINKEGNREWQLRGLEKEAREMAFEIESFLLKLMDEEPSHRHIADNDIRIATKLNKLREEMLIVCEKRRNLADDQRSIRGIVVVGLAAEFVTDT